jgi:hypothetical protein
MTAHKVTRQDLYEQVWKTPMSTLAAHYGVSDVALAKTCARLNVPRPGRGYWARLAAGEKLRRPPLPKPRPGENEWTFLQRVENPVPRMPRPTPPAVRAPKDLERAHDAIRELGIALGEAKLDQHERLVVDGGPHPTLAVTVATHRRALLLLDGLAKALVERGATAALEANGAQRRLVLRVAGEAMTLSVVERLGQKEHEPTPEEQERIAKGYRYGIPKYDHFPAGRLQLTLHDVHLQRSSWSDTDTRRLEQSLGSVILGAESEVERRRARRAQEEEEQRLREQQRREQEEEQQRQRDLQARAKHAGALVQSLKDMARDWSEAERIRAFLAAVGAALPVEQRNDLSVKWLEWAARRADELDPLSRPAEIAKDLHPRS